MDLSSLPTPALLLDRQVLTGNLDRMAERGRRLGVSLRPHIKTHKCVQVARLQQDRGAAGITVSTLPEAEAFAAAGFDDLTWAFPLPQGSIPRALDLAGRVTLRLMLDDAGTLTSLEDAARSAGRPVHTWLKIDCGYHRAGVDPATPEARDLAHRMASSEHILFDGVLTHAGHSYHARELSQRRRIAGQERDAVVEFADRMRSEGIQVPGVSVGSTPTLTAVEDLSGVTEIRPGNYAFFDLTQVDLGTCSMEAVAVSVLATVVSHPAGEERAVLDAGALALSKDTGPHLPEGTRMGGICPDLSATRVDPALHLTTISQEHGVVRPAGPGGLRDRLPVGSRVRILPNHSCLTTACFDELHVLEGQTIVETWPVHRRR